MLVPLVPCVLCRAVQVPDSALAAFGSDTATARLFIRNSRRKVAHLTNQLVTLVDAQVRWGAASGRQCGVAGRAGVPGASYMQVNA